MKALWLSILAMNKPANMKFINVTNLLETGIMVHTDSCGNGTHRFMCKKLKPNF